jgi:hypothetical protein
MPVTSDTSAFSAMKLLSTTTQAVWDRSAHHGPYTTRWGISNLPVGLIFNFFFFFFRDASVKVLSFGVSGRSFFPFFSVFTDKINGCTAVRHFLVTRYLPISFSFVPCGRNRRTMEGDLSPGVKGV